MFTFAKEIIPFIQDRVPKFVYAIIIFLIVTVESFSLLGINVFKDFDHTKTDHPIVHDYELVKKVQHLRIRNHASWTSIHLFHDDEGSLSIDVHQLENYKFSRIIESHEEILHPKKKKFTNIPISQYDQYIIYNLSMNYFSNSFNATNNNRFNYSNLIRLVLGMPIVGELTKVSFYNLIYFAYIFLNQLFTISQTLLLGKDPGIPKQFLDLFFPFHRQKYYYNLYLSWIQSRNKYLGFGDRINVSNGSGTYIPVPGRFTN